MMADMIVRLYPSNQRIHKTPDDVILSIVVGQYKFRRRFINFCVVAGSDLSET